MTTHHVPGCLTDGTDPRLGPCICDRLRTAYRAGFNDHANAVARGNAHYAPRNIHPMHANWCTDPTCPGRTGYDPTAKDNRP